MLVTSTAFTLRKETISQLNEIFQRIDDHSYVSPVEELQQLQHTKGLRIQPTCSHDQWEDTSARNSVSARLVGNSFFTPGRPDEAVLILPREFLVQVGDQFVAPNYGPDGEMDIDGIILTGTQEDFWVGRSGISNPMDCLFSYNTRAAGVTLRFTAAAKNYACTMTTRNASEVSMERFAQIWQQIRHTQQSLLNVDYRGLADGQNAAQTTLTLQQLMLLLQNCTYFIRNDMESLFVAHMKVGPESLRDMEAWKDGLPVVDFIDTRQRNIFSIQHQVSYPLLLQHGKLQFSDVRSGARIDLTPVMTVSPRALLTHLEFSATLNSSGMPPEVVSILSGQGVLGQAWDMTNGGILSDPAAAIPGAIPIPVAPDMVPAGDIEEEEEEENDGDDD